MLGGIQAVIWNDVVQFCIMFGGLAATVGIVWSTVPGGLAEIWSVERGGRKARLVAAARRSGGGRAVRADRELLSAADDARHAAGRAGGRPHGAVHQRSGDGAAPADHAVAAGRAVGVHGQRRRRRALDDRPVVCRVRAVCVLSARGLAAGVCDGQALAVLHVAGVSGRRGRPGHRRDHGGLALEHRLGDQFLHLGRGRRSLQPRVARRRDPQRDRSTRRASARRCGYRASRRCCSARSGTTLACNVSRIGSLLEINAKVVNAFTGPLFGIFLLAMFSRARQ